ncbi:MAG: hypothetical protein QNJ14_14405 [Woeseiaceae bacterium]|nr:hypothetical protein [Woeseiaceae bacterium]
MNSPFRSFWLLLLMAVALAACSDSDRDEVTGEGAIRALHAIPDLGQLSFLIEETSLGTLNYQESTGQSSFDDLEYEFSFEILLPDDDIDEPTVLASRTLSVDSDREYTFVLSGSLDNPQLFVWDQFGRDWIEELEDAEDNDTEVTVMEVSFGHISNVLGSVDVYLEEPGTSPTATTPRATLGFSEFIAATELPADDYQLVLTPVGEPETILFASDPFTIFAATSTLITLMDDGGLTTADFTARIIGTGLGQRLQDLDPVSAISAAHAAFGSTSLDVIEGDNFAEPLFENLSFGELSPEIEVEDGELQLIVTPSGNPGVFLSQRVLDTTGGSYSRLFLVGLPGDLQTVSLRYDRSTLATHARVQLFQGAARYQTLDVYLVNLDTDISLIGPTSSGLLYGTGFTYVRREPDVYNLVITEQGTKNIIGGPLEIPLEANENYSIILTDAPDITAVEVLLFNDT